MPRRGEASSERWALSSETGTSGTSGTSGMSGTGTEPGGTGGTWGEQRCSWAFQSLQVASTMGIIKKLCDCKLLHEKLLVILISKKKLPSESVRSFTIMCCHVFSMYFLCSRLGFTLQRYGGACHFVPKTVCQVLASKCLQWDQDPAWMLLWICLKLFKYVKMVLPCSEILGSFYILFYWRKHLATLCTPP